MKSRNQYHEFGEVVRDFIPAEIERLVKLGVVEIIDLDEPSPKKPKVKADASKNTGRKAPL